MTKAAVLEAEHKLKRSSAQRPGLTEGSEPLELDIPRYVVDLDVPLEAIGAALERGDEEEIWERYRAAGQQDQFLDWLGRMAASMSFPASHPKDSGRQSSWTQSLFLVPVIYPGGAAMPPLDEGIREAVFEEVRKDLEVWFGRDTRVSLHGALMPYDEISDWGPASLRKAISRFRGVTGAWPFRRGRQPRPPEWPALSFVVGCAHRWLTYPELPEVGVQDVLIVQKVRSRLALVDLGSSAPDVLMPEFFCEGVWSGLATWLGLLAEHIAAARVDVDLAGDDRLRLKLLGDEDDAPAAVVDLRLHHLGLGGFDLLLGDLIARQLCVAPTVRTGQ